MEAVQTRRQFLRTLEDLTLQAASVCAFGSLGLTGCTEDSSPAAIDTFIALPEEEKQRHLLVLAAKVGEQTQIGQMMKELRKAPFNGEYIPPTNFVPFDESKHVMQKVFGEDVYQMGSGDSMRDDMMIVQLPAAEVAQPLLNDGVHVFLVAQFQHMTHWIADQRTEIDAVMDLWHKAGLSSSDSDETFEMRFSYDVVESEERGVELRPTSRLSEFVFSYASLKYGSDAVLGKILDQETGKIDSEGVQALIATAQEDMDSFLRDYHEKALVISRLNELMHFENMSYAELTPDTFRDKLKENVRNFCESNQAPFTEDRFDAAFENISSLSALYSSSPWNFSPARTHVYVTAQVGAHFLEFDAASDRYVDLDLLVEETRVKAGLSSEELEIMANAWVANLIDARRGDQEITKKIASDYMKGTF